MFERRERYLRSLFISKFTYKASRQILGIQKLKVFLIGPKSGYTLMMLFSFLLTSRWPKISSSSRSAAKRTSSVILKCSYPENAEKLSRLFDRFVFLYFPNVEYSRDMRSRLSSKIIGTSVICVMMRRLFHIFCELDCLVNFALKYLKFFTKQWLFTMYFITTTTTTPYARRTAVRALYFPK